MTSLPTIGKAVKIVPSFRPWKTYGKTFVAVVQTDHMIPSIMHAMPTRMNAVPCHHRMMLHDLQHGYTRHANSELAARPLVIRRKAMDEIAKGRPK